MALPVIEQISQSMFSALSRITVANGYSAEAVVEYGERQGNKARDNLLVLERGPWRYAERQPHGHDRYVQTYHVVGYVLESEVSATAVDQRIAILAADIKKAVMVDVHRNNLADLTTPLGGWPFDHEDGSATGCVVDFEVTYTTLLDDPFTR